MNAPVCSLYLSSFILALLMQGSLSSIFSFLAVFPIFCFKANTSKLLLFSDDRL